MTEAVKAVMQYIFEQKPDIDMLSAFHFEENHRSRRVIEKCGFIYDCTISGAGGEYEGRQRDHVCYHLLREEYIP